MMKRAVFVAVLGLGLMAAQSARAQIGGGADCDSSPENPTLILAGLAAGGFALSSLRTRVRASRKSGKTE